MLRKQATLLGLDPVKQRVVVVRLVHRMAHLVMMLVGRSSCNSLLAMSGWETGLSVVEESRRSAYRPVEEFSQHMNWPYVLGVELPLLEVALSCSMEKQEPSSPG
jgi:hypothetical protein